MGKKTKHINMHHDLSSKKKKKEKKNANSTFCGLKRKTFMVGFSDMKYLIKRFSLAVLAFWACFPSFLKIWHIFSDLLLWGGGG